MAGLSFSSQRYQPRSALTLVDMVVTVLLMGILAAAAVPRFASSLQRNRVSAAAQRVCADVRLARNSAIASSASKRIDFNLAQGTYTLVGIASGDRVNSDYSVVLSSGGYEVKITSANLGGDASLTFDINGQPDSGGTIVLACGSHTKTITVNSATGEATAP